MSSLSRLASGNFAIGDCVTINELEAMEPDERFKLLRPTESLFSDLEAVKLPPFFEKLSRDGNEIYQKKAGTDFTLGTKLRLVGKNGFYALAEIRDYPDGSAIKVIKLFEI